ncbi:hypothetical protein SPBRAN_1770 [uncultured Candidatus Thioglobus sp.]|nr:hypothetical protein SPBRAN_1770 [uncultured Candidatus Thioglobus sp.]
MVQWGTEIASYCPTHEMKFPSYTVCPLDHAQAPQAVLLCFEGDIP